MPYIQYGSGGKVTITGINANDITDTLSIKIATINGRDAESQAHQMGIRVLLQSEYDRIPSIVENRMQMDNLRQYDISFAQNSTRLTAYRGTATTIAIPWGPTVINERVFQNKGLMSVILPSSLLIIGKEAFYGNRLTSIIIPDSVIEIGNTAFGNNLLTSIIIPDGVAIGSFVFQENTNTLKSITIGVNVRLVSSSFSQYFGGDSFQTQFNNNGRRAGTYSHTNDSYPSSAGDWRYSPRRQ